MATKAHPLVRESVEFHRRALEAELQIANERLRVFEVKHGFSSAVFARRFEAGRLGDDREWFDWWGEWVCVKAVEEKIAALRSLR